MPHGSHLVKMSAKMMLVTLMLGVILTSSNAFNPWDLMNQRMTSMFRNIFARVQETADRQQARMRNLQRNFDPFGDQDNGYYSPVDSSGEVEKEFNPDTVIVDKPANPFSVFGPGFPFVKIPIPTPWWTGPNVCEEKETLEGGGDDDGSGLVVVGFSRSTSCQSTDTVHLCTTRISDENGMRKYVTKQHCCPGYHRDRDGPGCIPVPKRSMAEILSANGGSEFVDLARSSENLLERDNITVLCPTDAALEPAHPEANVVRRRRRSTRSPDMIRSHIIPGFYLADVLLYQHPVLTALDGSTKIHFQAHLDNHRTVTANCVPIVKPDLLAGRSVAQMVERAIPVPKKTLAELVQSDPQLRRWEKVLRSQGLWSQLEDPAASLTLLAPVDSALAGTDVTSNPCLRQLVRAHIAHRRYCSASTGFRAFSGRSLKVRRDLAGKVSFSGVPAVSTDLVATNGVLHKLSGVVIPDDAKPLMEVLEKKNYTKFIGLVERAGLKERFNSFNNVTVFVPSNAAIAAMKVEEIEEPEALKQLLLHHVALGSSILSGRRELRTLESQSPPLHVDQRFVTTVDCGRVALQPPSQACGDVRIYTVNRVLIPATRSLLTTLQEIPQASHFTRLLRNASIASMLENPNITLTLIVPMDDAITRMPARKLRQLERDPKMAESFIKAHIITGRTCKAMLGTSGMESLFPSSFFVPATQTLHTLGGGSVQVSRELGTDNIRLGGSARLVRPDLLASNGVIHLVSQVLSPPRHFFNHILAMFL